MSELSKNFIPTEIENKWYQHWLQKGYFNSVPDKREPYTIVMPPPDVTGVLHMGHCLNNTIQDILIRRARMQGKNACWVPGTDHASIATEAKVVGMLREKGIAKSSLSREKLLEYAWEWKEKYGGIILEQLKKLGCSVVWNRTSFTMDDDYYQSVILVFIDLYKKGYIYRGQRMIHWDVKAKTALSDEEVIRKETHQKLYYIRYAINNGAATNEYITIATVRPETIMGDVAICVHPNDERYKHLHGKTVFVPLIHREIPIITDEYVAMDFGTGALKITPAHDANDYALGIKPNLPVIDIWNDDGTLNELAQIGVSLDRFEARKLLVEKLTEANHIVKVEDYTSEVGYSERTDAVVKPRLSLQWWVKMKEHAVPAWQAVMEHDIAFHPAKFKNLYNHWMSNIKDWCISRQLWWGHRIPAWYDASGNYAVAATAEEALIELQKNNPQLTLQQIHQDEDCLNTWFSSWLWPFEVFKGLSQPNNADVQYYYPTNTLVTAPEIILFWVARMIMAGYEFMNQLPFKNVYFTGIVRDKLGRKMSKSLRNSPDLLALIDTYGADAVRFGIMIASPAGNDILFDEAILEQGRNFIKLHNKIWNALKLVKLWEVRITDNEINTNDTTFALQWFENRLAQVQQEVEDLMQLFKLSEALKVIYSLIWDDFCSWYLEWVKPGFEQPISKKVYTKTVEYFDALLQVLHPYMPFITEEIYHQLANRNSDLCVKLMLPILQHNQKVLEEGKLLKQVITAIREARVKNNIKPKDAIELFVETTNAQVFSNIQYLISKQVNTSSFQIVNNTIANSIVVAVETHKLYIVSTVAIDNTALKENLLKDLAYQKNFLQSVEKKLNNEKFVQNASPAVVAMEKKKKADDLARIQTIEESLKSLQ
jgi:valyl-tRNA synthetase